MGTQECRIEHEPHPGLALSTAPPQQGKLNGRVVDYFELSATLHCSQRGLPPVPGARL